MKKIIKKSVGLLLIGLLTVLPNSYVLAESAQEIDSEKQEHFYIQCTGLDEYENMNTYGDLWHENLPSYSGRKIPLSIDVESIKKYNARDNIETLCQSVASVQIDRLTESGESVFSYWNGAQLSEPLTIYNLDESIYGTAYGVVDEYSKLVGYMIVGANEGRCAAYFRVFI